MPLRFDCSRGLPFGLAGRVGEPANPQAKQRRRAIAMSSVQIQDRDLTAPELRGGFRSELRATRWKTSHPRIGIHICRDYMGWLLCPWGVLHAPGFWDRGGEQNAQVWG